MERALKAQQVYEELGSPFWLSHLLSEPPQLYLETEVDLKLGKSKIKEHKVYVFSNVFIIANADKGKERAKKKTITNPEDVDPGSELFWLSNAQSPVQIASEVIDKAKENTTTEEDFQGLIRTLYSEADSDEVFGAVLYAEIAQVRPFTNGSTISVQFKLEETRVGADDKHSFVIDAQEIPIEFKNSKDMDTVFTALKEAVTYQENLKVVLSNNIVKVGQTETLAQQNFRASVTRLKAQHNKKENKSMTTRPKGYQINAWSYQRLEDELAMPDLNGEMGFQVRFHQSDLGLVFVEKNKNLSISQILENSIAGFAGANRGDMIRQVGDVTVENGTSVDACMKLIESNFKDGKLDVLFFRTYERERRRQQDEKIKAQNSLKENKPIQNDHKKDEEQKSESVSDEMPVFAFPQKKNRDSVISQTTDGMFKPNGGAKSGKKKRRNTRRSQIAKKKESVKKLSRLQNQDGFRYYNNHKGVLENGAENVAKLFEKMLGYVDRSSERACIFALREIYNTEMSYVEDLEHLANAKRKCMQKKRYLRCKEVKGSGIFCQHTKVRALCSKKSEQIQNAIKSSDIDILFLNIKSVIQINSKIMQDLDVALSDMYEQSEKGREIPVSDVLLLFCKIFIEVAPYLTMYSVYCKRYSAALQMEKHLRSTNTFYEDIVQQIEKTNKTKIPTLLIKPIQRITKYPLLFSSLINYVQKYIKEKSSNANSDFEHVAEVVEKMVNQLEVCFKSVTRVVEKVNQSVGDAENIVLLLEANTEIGGRGPHKVEDLIVPWRKYVDKIEGISFQNLAMENKDAINAVTYIFSDLIVLATGFRRTANSFAKNGISGYGTRAASKFVNATMKRRKVSRTSTGNLTNTLRDTGVRIRNSSRVSMQSFDSDARFQRGSMSSQGGRSGDKPGEDGSLDYSVLSVFEMENLLQPQLVERNLNEDIFENDFLTGIDQTGDEQYGVQFLYKSLSASGPSQEIIFWFVKEETRMKFHEKVIKQQNELESKKKQMKEAGGHLVLRRKKKNT